MNLEKIIAIRNAKTIYKDGDNCVKVFNNNYLKSDILNEALNHARADNYLSMFLKSKKLVQLKENGR